MSRKLAPTYQHKLFHDDELALPSHDAICRWVDLTAQNNPAVLLRKLNITGHEDNDGDFCSWSEELVDNDEWDDKVGTICRRIAVQQKPELSFPPKVIVESVVWEPIIKSERGGLVGAADLKIRFQIPIPELKYDVSRTPLSDAQRQALTDVDFSRFEVFVGENEQIWRTKGGERHPCPITVDTKGFLSKFVIENQSLFRISDLRWECQSLPWGYKTLEVMCEAKTTIRTVGEVLRQIKLYKSHGHRLQRWIVVAPAEAWPTGSQDIFTEQGVTPISYLSN